MVRNSHCSGYTCIQCKIIHYNITFHTFVCGVGSSEEATCNKKKQKVDGHIKENKGKDQMTQKTDNTTSKNANKCFSTKHFKLDLKISKIYADDFKCPT